MSIKKCVNGSFVNDFYKEYGTDTDTITTLPKTIIGDGQNISAYTIKGNMQQSGTPAPSNPIYPSETGDKTANLFDVSKVVSGDLTVSGTTITKGSSAYNIDLFSGLSGASTAMSTNSMVLEAGTYTLAYDLVTGNVNLFLICVCPYTSATREPVDKYFDGYNGKSFTISEKSYVSFRVQQNTAVEVKDVAVYSGSTAPPSYEPYGMYKIPISLNNVTYPIYISEPLRKSLDGSNLYDTIESNGTLTRRVDANGDALATPTTEQVTVPTLTTTGTAEQFNVTTTLAPSEVSLTYHGWHEHEDTKFTNP